VYIEYSVIECGACKRPILKEKYGDHLDICLMESYEKVSKITKQIELAPVDANNQHEALNRGLPENNYTSDTSVLGPKTKDYEEEDIKRIIEIQENISSEKDVQLNNDQICIQFQNIIIQNPQIVDEVKTSMEEVNEEDYQNTTPKKFDLPENRPIRPGKTHESLKINDLDLTKENGIANITKTASFHKQIIEFSPIRTKKTVIAPKVKVKVEKIIENVVQKNENSRKESLSNENLTKLRKESPKNEEKLDSKLLSESPEYKKARQTLTKPTLSKNVQSLPVFEPLIDIDILLNSKSHINTNERLQPSKTFLKRGNLNPMAESVNISKQPLDEKTTSNANATYTEPPKLRRAFPSQSSKLLYSESENFDVRRSISISQKVENHINENMAMVLQNLDEINKDHQIWRDQSRKRFSALPGISIADDGYKLHHKSKNRSNSIKNVAKVSQQNILNANRQKIGDCEIQKNYQSERNNQKVSNMPNADPKVINQIIQNLPATKMNHQPISNDVAEVKTVRRQISHAPDIPSNSNVIPKNLKSNEVKAQVLEAPSLQSKKSVKGLVGVDFNDYFKPEDPFAVFSGKAKTTKETGHSTQSEASKNQATCHGCDRVLAIDKIEQHKKVCPKLLKRKS
jgi:hypothetical protein